MKTTSIVALTALLSTGALAVPMAGPHHAAPAHGHLHQRNKRDIVWVTEYEIETVTVVKTIYDDGSEPEPTAAATSAYGSASVTTTSYSAPAYTSSSSSASSPAETSSSAPASTASSTLATSTQTSVPSSSSTTSSYVAPPAPTTSSTTEAPAPTTYSEPAPAPTTTTTYSEPAPAPSSSASSAAPAPTQSSGGYSGGGSTAAGASYTGDATHWDPALGACGETNTSDELVVAISQTLFDPSTPGGNPNNNPLCGRYVSIKNADGGSTSAKVVDRCVGCKEGDLDMTTTLFNKVTNNGDGRVSGMEWQWA